MRERIALLFGIPVSEAAFRERAATARWDYGRTLIAQRSVAETFERIYAPVVSVAESVIHAARGLGATVATALTVAELERVSGDHDVLVVVAHWRGSMLDGADLLPGWVERLAVAAGEDQFREAAAILLRKDLALGAAFGRGAPDGPQLRSLAADTLNRLIRANYFAKWLPAGIGTELETGRTIIDALSRDFVDMMFGDFVAPGNQLELCDGLHGVGAIHAALPSGFVGTLDLSCCTSSVLGTYLKIARNDAFDVIMGDPLVVPAPQLRLLQGTLELMAEEPALRYSLARRALSQALSKWSPSERD